MLPKKKKKREESAAAYWCFKVCSPYSIFGLPLTLFFIVPLFQVPFPCRGTYAHKYRQI
jgi:hypothetical protein